MLVPLGELLGDASAGGYAVVYPEAWDMYSLEAVLEAAEDENAPVVLGFGGVMMEPGWFDGGGLERLAAFGLTMARGARVPVSFILNEVTTLDQAMRGIRAGFNVVMMSPGELSYDESVQLTRRLVAEAHTAGVSVEAELGSLPDATGDKGEEAGTFTDPQEAASFVAETGIDALAVSVGNVHSLSGGQASIDWERLAALHEAVPVPLVLHGGTGFPEEGIVRAISLGVTKVNIGTALKQAFLDGLAEAVGSLPTGISAHHTVGSRKPADVLQQGKDRVREEARRRIRLWRPW
jgi:ketose-bisphosphate aldolase